MSIAENVVKLKNSLSEIVVGKEDLVNGVILGLLSKEPVYLDGPVGIAKTLTVSLLAKLCNLRYFYYQLNEFTQPDEIFGVVDIVAYREERTFKRFSERKLPWAEIVFLDEIFRASSAIRGTLLDIILNRRMVDGNMVVELPMITLYTASNEVSTDSEDRAFYDRLTIRVFADKLPAKYWDELINVGTALEAGLIEIKSFLTKEAVEQLYNVVIQRMLLFRKSNRLKRLAKAIFASVDEYDISDRRKVKFLKVAAAVSVLRLEKEGISDYSLYEAARYVFPSSRKVIGEMAKKIEEGLVAAGSTIGLMSQIETKARNLFETYKQMTKAQIWDNKDMFIQGVNEIMMMIEQLPKDMKNSYRVVELIKKLKIIEKEASEVVEL